MPLKITDAKLDTPTARIELTIRNKPYPGPNVAPGVQMLYRRNAANKGKSNGSWVLKQKTATGKYATKNFAFADDYTKSDGAKVLAFHEATKVALEIATGGDGTEIDTTGKPITVDGALVIYKAALVRKKKRTENAQRPRPHLTATLLARPVMLLSASELETWRDGLIAGGKIARSTINRICNALRSAFEMAKLRDKRIKSNDAWMVGLKTLGGANKARNTFLDIEPIRELIVTSYDIDDGLGLLVDTVAVTGTRPIQASRLLVEDLKCGDAPRLMMPFSWKGGDDKSDKMHERYSVPITHELALNLKKASAGRADDEPLLLQSNGQPWGEKPYDEYCKLFRSAVECIGEDPSKVTMYTLRHSSIMRMLKLNKPIKMVASWHNTSVEIIETNYGRFINEHLPDEMMRSALPSFAEPNDNTNVVQMR